MHYQLSYNGAPGNISAYLLFDGTTIATATDLKDAKAAVKWGQSAARDHKVENTPEASESHAVVLSGTKTFSL